MPSNNLEQFYELLEKFDTAMLVTRTRDGQMRGRPMAIAEEHGDGMLWFATDVESPKIEELELDDRVNVTMQDGRKFLSVSGRGELVTDRAKIRELYTARWKPYFPGGEDDPNIALICFKADFGEYWDAEGIRGLKFMFEAGKSALQGKRAQRDDDDLHGKVDFH